MAPFCPLQQISPRTHANSEYGPHPLLVFYRPDGNVAVAYLLSLGRGHKQALITAADIRRGRW